MNVEEIITEISLETGEKDRAKLLKFLSAELNYLTGKAEWDWAMVRLDPIISAIVGQREYNLPNNFGLNFVRYGGAAGQEWCCLLDDGTNESILHYISPAQFFSKDLRGEANGRPQRFTILSTPNGQRQLHLSPAPDSATFTIDGLYIPTDWKIEERSQLPPIPGNSEVLKLGVMRRLDPNREPAYSFAVNLLMLREAQGRRSQLVPDYQTRNYRMLI
jgi:hypothetical protein